MHMKQIDVMFERFLNAKKPLKAKWQLRLMDNGDLLVFHYHHHFITYSNGFINLIEYPETKADARGIRSVVNYLDKNMDLINIRLLDLEDPVFQNEYRLIKYEYKGELL